MMKKYDKNDLKILDPEIVVKNNPERYFGTSEVNTKILINALKEQHSLESSDLPKYFESDGWSFFGSRYDWIKSGLTEGKCTRDLFSLGGGISSKNNNPLRIEYFIYIFSSSIILFRKNEIEVIKGYLNEEISNILRSEYTEMTAIAFTL